MEMTFTLYLDIYEADGLKLHELSSKNLQLYAAESLFISDDFSNDLNFTINKRKGKGFKKTATDVYYIRQR